MELVLKQEKIILDLQNEYKNFIQEQKKREIEENDIKAKLSVNIQSDQSIKGTIEIIKNEENVDETKSKYILNTNSSDTIGFDGYNEGNSIDKFPKEFSITKPSGTYYLHALIASKKGILKEFISKPITTKGLSLTFSYTGRVQSATLFPGQYKLEVWGSEGGKNGSYNVSSGKGGYSVGILTLISQTTLYIYVGESPKSEKGGWNGGGSGGHGAAGGGGSTDISLYGTEGSTEWNNMNHLYSRIIVAGAGGGSGDDGSSNENWEKYHGGYGGGIVGESSGYGPQNNEGTQTRAGTNKSCSTGQSFGIGGNHTRWSSGGGGGWYGGGASNNSGSNTGGSGGSGYVYNASNSANYPNGCKLNSQFYLSNSATHAGNTSFPAPNGSNETGHSGNGYARITVLGKQSGLFVRTFKKLNKK